MALGGSFAAGVQARRNRDLRAMEMQSAQTQEFTATVNSLTEAMKLVVDDAVNFRASTGKEPPDAFRNSFQRSAIMLANLRRNFIGGNDATVEQEISSQLSRYDAAIQSALTPTEKASQEGRAAVAGAQATAEAATAAGVPSTTGQALTAAGVLPAPETPSIINFQFPDGTIEAVDQNNTEAVQAAINRGGRRISLGVQAATVGDLVTQPTKKEIGETRASVGNLQAGIDDVKRVLGEFQKTPEAGGVRGTLIESVGGVVDQIGQALGREGVFESITGASPEEVKGVRTEARALASSLLSFITKEETRFTDQERALAEQILGTLDAEASDAQIQEALRRSQGMLERAQNRDLARLLSASGADLSTEAGAMQFLDVLEKNGFTDAQASDALLRMLERLGLPTQFEEGNGQPERTP